MILLEDPPMSPRVKAQPAIPNKPQVVEAVARALFLDSSGPDKQIHADEAALTIRAQVTIFGRPGMTPPQLGVEKDEIVTILTHLTAKENIGVSAAFPDLDAELLSSGTLSGRVDATFTIRLQHIRTKALLQLGSSLVRQQARAHGKNKRLFGAIATVCGISSPSEFSLLGTTPASPFWLLVPTSDARQATTFAQELQDYGIQGVGTQTSAGGAPAVTLLIANVKPSELTKQLRGALYQIRKQAAKAHRRMKLAENVRHCRELIEKICRALNISTPVEIVPDAKRPTIFRLRMPAASGITDAERIQQAFDAAPGIKCLWDIHEEFVRVTIAGRKIRHPPSPSGKIRWMPVSTAQFGKMLDDLLRQITERTESAPL